MFGDYPSARFPVVSGARSRVQGAFSMRVSRSAVLAILLAAGLIWLCPDDAHAYLDPGTGSYVLQLVIAALLGAAFALKVFWLRIKGFFSNLVSKKHKDD
jgi:hypothetical protein